MDAQINTTHFVEFQGVLSLSFYYSNISHYINTDSVIKYKSTHYYWARCKNNAERGDTPFGSSQIYSLSVQESIVYLYMYEGRSESLEPYSIRKKLFVAET